MHSISQFYTNRYVPKYSAVVKAGMKYYKIVQSAFYLSIRYNLFRRRLTIDRLQKMFTDQTTSLTRGARLIANRYGDEVYIDTIYR